MNRPDIAPGTIILSGASRGLGLVLMRHLLESECTVAGFARHATTDVGQLVQEYSNRARFESLDALDAPGIEGFLDRSMAFGGPIRALVNNAAVGQDQMLAHLGPQVIESLLSVNLRAPILLTRSVVRRMLIAGTPGRIVNITSICGSRGFAGLTVYSAAKGGLEAFTRSLARELGPRGILVNAIAPGFFASEMSKILSSEQVETIRRRTPTERLITPEEIIPLLDLLLFSDSNLTGQILRVDGGSST